MGETISTHIRDDLLSVSEFLSVWTCYSYRMGAADSDPAESDPAESDPSKSDYAESDLVESEIRETDPAGSTSRTFDPDAVAEIYDELIDTYQLEWRRQGHHSLHLAWYDDDHETPGSASINTMRVLSEAIGIEPGDRILNIGCGVGEDSVWNARAYDATVVGINISETQLEMARQNVAGHGVEESTSFRFDDFHELSTIESNSIDVVWGLEALSHSPDRRAVLEQIRRVLVPGGRIGFTDLFLTGSVDESPEADSRESERAMIDRVNEGLHLHLGSIRVFEKHLEESGFESVTVRDGTTHVRECTNRRYRFARLAYPVGRLLGLVGIFSAAQLDAFKASADIHRLIEAGSLGYYVITAKIPD